MRRKCGDEIFVVLESSVGGVNIVNIQQRADGVGGWERRGHEELDGVILLSDAMEMRR